MRTTKGHLYTAAGQASAVAITDHFSTIARSQGYTGVGRGCGVGRVLGVGVSLGVELGVDVTVVVAVGEGVGLGVQSAPCHWAARLPCENNARC